MPTKSTPAQTTANRANAARSTGPRTPAGKARSSQNARKHSFAGSGFTIVKIEDTEAVDRLRADLIAVYQPANSQELFAVERIAIAQHNLLRVARVEAGLLTAALNRAVMSLDQEVPLIPLHEELQVNAQQVQAQNRNYFLAQGFHMMNSDSSTTWTLFLRYQAQVERQYRRAIEEFERLKRLRNVLPNEPNFPTDPKQTTATSEPQNEPNSAPETSAPILPSTKSAPQRHMVRDAEPDTVSPRRTRPPHDRQPPTQSPTP